ncbi:hypothetical protein H4S06_003248 [Coemansia sp. BCRC 34490]|nr:hypothetical protein H4S06_003248 [Coemansia sp. BCRC 34490]
MRIAATASYARKIMLLLLGAVCVGFLQHPRGAMGLNVTCAGFDTLSMITYDNVTPQALSSVIIAFKTNTPKQIMDSFFDALQCRGSSMRAPNYNTLTLLGLIAKTFFTELKSSGFIAAVEEDSIVSALPQVTLAARSSTVASALPVSSSLSTKHSGSLHSLVATDSSESLSDTSLSHTSSSSSAGLSAMGGAGNRLLLLLISQLVLAGAIGLALH